MRTAVSLLLLALLGAAIGCSNGPKLHPVSGQLDLKGGDVAHLAGSTVELASVSDPTVRAAGAIGADGRFAVETLLDGAVRKGAREGKYKVRVILTDDDRESRKKAAKAIDPKFLQFETSGLTIEVPPPGEVRLGLSAK